MSGAVGLLPSAPAVDITALSWTQLNTTLLDCEDLAVLGAWLEATIASGHVTRAVRVYGRLSAVRRHNEFKDMKRRVALARKGKGRG